MGTLIIDANVGVFASRRKMTSTFGKFTAVQRVILLFNRKQFFHGGYMVILENSHPKYHIFYVFVTPTTLILVFKVGRHLMHVAGSYNGHSTVATMRPELPDDYFKEWSIAFLIHCYKQKR